MRRARGLVKGTVALSPIRKHLFKNKFRNGSPIFVGRMISRLVLFMAALKICFINKLCLWLKRILLKMTCGDCHRLTNILQLTQPKNPRGKYRLYQRPVNCIFICGYSFDKLRLRIQNSSSASALSRQKSWSKIKSIAAETRKEC